jgi:anti-sigma B factor antagonist
VADQLTIHRRQDTGVATFVLVGELDAGVVSRVDDELKAAARSQAVLIVDLSGIQFIDSSGMHLLVELQPLCAEHGGRLVLVPGPPRVRRVFEILGLEERFDYLDASRVVPQDG